MIEPEINGTELCLRSDMEEEEDLSDQTFLKRHLRNEIKERVAVSNDKKQAKQHFKQRTRMKARGTEDSPGNRKSDL